MSIKADQRATGLSFSNFVIFSVMFLLFLLFVFNQSLFLLNMQSYHFFCINRYLSLMFFYLWELFWVFGDFFSL